GIGVSNPTIAKWHGVPFDLPLARVAEYVDLVRRAMSGEKLNFDGRFFSAHGFKMASGPSGRAIPIYLAAFGPRMSRLAGMRMDGVLINMANPSEIGRIVAEARKGAKEAGKNPERLEIICKVRCSVAADYASARQALSGLLTYYVLADYYRDLLSRMGFAADVQAMRAAWQKAGFHAAREMITDRLFDGVPLIAATSVKEIREKIKPYAEAGATRIILPYVPSSKDVVGEIKRFISAWDKDG
ncbi:MAG: LLM class flavin-dependent oxidoreductase, partial [Candidatus Binatia bacterium]